jgi:hypothetical protein
MDSKTSNHAFSVDLKFSLVFPLGGTLRETTILQLWSQIIRLPVSKIYLVTNPKLWAFYQQ